MNILIPTDFSEVANVAVRYAAMFARKLDAKIIYFMPFPTIEVKKLVIFAKA